MNTKLIDARGLSCPQPVMLVQKIISVINSGDMEVLVDSGVSRDNVTRFAENSGWKVIRKDLPDGSCRLELKK